MQTEINNIHQNDGNPRKISKAKMSDLVNSVLAFPEMLEYRSIVADKQGVIIGGNMRHKALQAIFDMDIADIRGRLQTSIPPEEVESKVAYWVAWKKKPVVRVETADMDVDERTEFIIKDNGDFGEWDKKKMEQLYADVFQSYDALSAEVAQFGGVQMETPQTKVHVTTTPTQTKDSASQNSDFVSEIMESADDDKQGETAPTPTVQSSNLGQSTTNDYEQEQPTEQVVSRGFYEPPTYCDYLQLDGYKIPVTSLEKERYMNLLDNYCEENGISYGFINYIKNGMGIIK